MKGKERGFLRFGLRSLVHKWQHYGVVGYGMGQVEHQRCSETITIDRGRGVSLSFLCGVKFARHFFGHVTRHTAITTFFWLGLVEFAPSWDFHPEW